MAVSSVLVMGLLGLAGLSVSASLVIVAVTPGAGNPPESERQGPLRAAAAARDHGVPVFDAPEHMPPLVHGAWETLFLARGG